MKSDIFEGISKGEIKSILSRINDDETQDLVSALYNSGLALERKYNSLLIEKEKQSKKTGAEVVFSDTCEDCEYVLQCRKFRKCQESKIEIVYKELQRNE